MKHESTIWEEKLLLIYIYLFIHTGWWFQRFFTFIPTWGNDPIWLIFFKWVETTNSYICVLKWHFSPVKITTVSEEGPIQTTSTLHRTIMDISCCFQNILVGPTKSAIGSSFSSSLLKCYTGWNWNVSSCGPRVYKYKGTLLLGELNFRHPASVKTTQTWAILQEGECPLRRKWRPMPWISCWDDSV